jgi:hypothetical protein
MEYLEIKPFTPAKDEIIKAVEQYKTLEINGVDDKKGYKKVQTAKVALKRVKNMIKKQGLAGRRPALDHQKAVIAMEKEFLALVEPTIELLQGKQNDIDDEVTRAYAMKALPERKAKLAAIDVIVDDVILLRMDPNFFLSFLNNEKAKYLEVKERMLNDAKIQLFLQKHGCTKTNKADFYVKTDGSLVTLYKKVAGFKL